VDIDGTDIHNKTEDSFIDEQEIEFKVEKVKRSILALPDGYRTVLSLYLLEGYDHEEIAEILNVAPSTTRTQYTRAKQKLLQILKEGI
jgi:RNA polymerase sigma-70 factor (ECF subfamily)